MTPRQRVLARLLAPLVIAAAALCQAALPAQGAGGGGSAISSSPPSSSGSGGAGLEGGGLAPVASPPTNIPPPPSKHAKGKWLSSVTVTEYWPAPESWFVGKLVTAPGLPGLHRIDWLYSATGLSMEGSGIGLDGQQYHIDALGDGGWVTETGASTSPSSGWSAGAPYWRAGGYWRNKKRGVTFPLSAGGWSNGRGAKYVPLRDVTFAAGMSLPLPLPAVDRGGPEGHPARQPRLRPGVPRGRPRWLVRRSGHRRRHQRAPHRRVPPPPVNALGIGQSLSAQRIFVIKPTH